MPSLFFRRLTCAAVLASVATLSLADDSASENAGASINAPPNELIHPEQFGIEDFGHLSAAAVLAAMPASPSTPATKGGAGPAPNGGSLPTQIANGDFSGTDGWNASIIGNLLSVPQVAGSTELHRNGGNGAPAPSGWLIGLGNHSTVHAHTACATYGFLWQDVRVLPGTWLTFNWRASVDDAPGVAGSLGVSLRDPITDRELWRETSPAWTTLNGARYSQFDLGRFSGQDLRIRFESQPSPTTGSGASCRDGTWIDNVKLTPRPIVYSTVRPAAGAWYNALRSGSGWELRRASLTSDYFGIWYTFQGGQPIWYFLDQGSVVNGVFDTRIRHFQRSGTSSIQTVVGRAQLQTLSSTTAIMRFDFYDVPNGNNGWDREEFYTLLTPAGGTYSGSWNDDVAGDPHWGIGTFPYNVSGNSGSLFSMQYFYTSAGAPTWTFAQGSYDGSNSLSVVRRSGGLCPTCPGYTPDMQTENTGIFSPTFPADGKMHAAFSSGSWVRPEHPFNKLTN